MIVWRRYIKFLKHLVNDMELPVNYDEMEHTQRRVVRAEYVKIQGGKCFHCGEMLRDDPSSDVKSKTVNESLFPDTFFTWPVHLHHNHNTGMTIGAEHSYCNAVLWEFHGE